MVCTGTIGTDQFKIFMIDIPSILHVSVILQHDKMVLLPIIFFQNNDTIFYIYSKISYGENSSMNRKELLSKKLSLQYNQDKKSR